MKKLFYALCVCSVLAFAGCSDDDDTPSVDLSLLYGKWRFTEVRWSDSEGSGSEPMTGLDARIMTINPDHTGSYASEYYEEKFVWQVNRYLIFTFDDGDVDAYTIEFLTADELMLGQSSVDSDGPWSEVEVYERVE